MYSFHEMSYNFSEAGIENLPKTQSQVRALSCFEPGKLHAASIRVYALLVRSSTLKNARSELRV